VALMLFECFKVKKFVLEFEKVIFIKFHLLFHQLKEKYNEQLKDCSNQVNESYKIGYNKATQIWRTKLSQIKIPVPVVDTIKITLKDKLALKLLEQDLATANKELADSKLSNEKAQGKKDKWFLMFIIACCLLVTSIYFNIRK
jgi:hypothetical protein